jgi:hypothetical protein
VHDEVLETVADTALVVYAVWEPIFRTDDEKASRRATTLLDDPRVKHYWAPTLDLGRAFQKPIDLTSEPAWDVYLVYPAGVTWENEPPRPRYFMHQLNGRLPDASILRGDVLAQHVREAMD